MTTSKHAITNLSLCTLLGEQDQANLYSHAKIESAHLMFEGHINLHLSVLSLYI